MVKAQDNSSRDYSPRSPKIVKMKLIHSPQKPNQDLLIPVRPGPPQRTPEALSGEIDQPLFSSARTTRYQVAQELINGYNHKPYCFIAEEINYSSSCVSTSAI
jgi:hypothetical protein